MPLFEEYNFGVNQLTLIQSGSSQYSFPQNDGDYIYREQLKHYFNCIENEKLPSVSIHDGVAVLNMIVSAKKSLRLNERVALA